MSRLSRGGVLWGSGGGVRQPAELFSLVSRGILRAPPSLSQLSHLSQGLFCTAPRSTQLLACFLLCFGARGVQPVQYSVLVLLRTSTSSSSSWPSSSSVLLYYIFFFELPCFELLRPWY
eukprot:s1138_g4.t1